MGKYKGIIFDLDGTLLDSIEDIGDSMNQVLKELELPTFNYEEYKLKVGGGFRGLALNIFPKDTSEDNIEEAVKLFSNFYDKNYLNKTRPYEGILEILNNLKDREIKLGVNSNKRDDYTNDLVDKHFKDIPFVKVYGDREGVVKKPDPTSALEIAESMNLDVEEIIYIGDSNVDILTAKNAKMDSGGVLWGFRSKKELIDSGAKYIIEKPCHILDLV